VDRRGPLRPHTDGQLEEQIFGQSDSFTASFRSFFGGFGPQYFTAICTVQMRETDRRALEEIYEAESARLSWIVRAIGEVIFRRRS
jgi:hypothetical protein